MARSKMDIVYKRLSENELNRIIKMRNDLYHSFGHGRKTVRIIWICS